MCIVSSQRDHRLFARPMSLLFDLHSCTTDEPDEMTVECSFSANETVECGLYYTADFMQFYNFTDFPFDFNFTVFYKLHLNEKASAGEIVSEILWFKSSLLQFS